MNNNPKENKISSQAYQNFPPIEIIAQYVKDLSFEAPLTPSIFQDLREQTPDIPISVDIVRNSLKDKQEEITIKVHIEATLGEKTAFLLELAYSCVVKLKHLPEDQIDTVLLIETPRLIFPFMRQIISDITVQGGFPPLMLQLVDFENLYQRK